MPLIWMFDWNREMMLEIEKKFLFYNLERFSSDFTLYDSIQKRINVFLSSVISDLFLTVLRNRKRGN